MFCNFCKPEDCDYILIKCTHFRLSQWEGFPGGSDGSESAHSVEDPGSISWWEDPMEKEMATHSNILAWRIPWTEEPGGLQPTGLQRVGRN